MFSWSSQAEEVLKVRESIPKQVDKKSEGSRGERVWSSEGGGKDKHLFFSAFLSLLSHLKHFFLFCFLSFFRPRTDDYTTQLKLCERK